MNQQQKEEKSRARYVKLMEELGIDPTSVTRFEVYDDGASLRWKAWSSGHMLAGTFGRNWG